MASPRGCSRRVATGRARVGREAPAAPPGGQEFVGRRNFDYRHHQNAGLRHQTGRADAAVLRGPNLAARKVNGLAIPPIVTQIGDGENGGVMMNEFPNCYRQAIRSFNTDGVVNANVTEYLELIERAGVREDMLPPIRPVQQGAVLARIKKWELGAADKAIAEIKREKPGFNMDGGSWTNNISWVKGYENVLTPMNRFSAMFHEKLDKRTVDKNSHAYRNVLFHLLMSETSCFRYWGQGVWTEYGQEIIRRGTEILNCEFK